MTVGEKRRENGMIGKKERKERWKKRQGRREDMRRKERREETTSIHDHDEVTLRRHHSTSRAGTSLRTNDECGRTHLSPFPGQSPMFNQFNVPQNWSISLFRLPHRVRFIRTPSACPSLPTNMYTCIWCRLRTLVQNIMAKGVSWLKTFIATETQRCSCA